MNLQKRTITVGTRIRVNDNYQGANAKPGMTGTIALADVLVSLDGVCPVWVVRFDDPDWPYRAWCMANEFDVVDT